MNLSYRIAYVFYRNLVSYKRFVVPTFIASLVQPLFYLITFGIGMGAYVGLFGGKPYLNFLVPGVLISAVALSASYECLYGTFVKMIHEKLYDSLIATPVSAEDAVAGDIAWAVLPGHDQRDADDDRRHVHGRLPGLRPGRAPELRPHGLRRGPVRLPGHDRDLGRAELRFLQLLHRARPDADALLLRRLLSPGQFPGLDEVVLPVPAADPRRQDLPGGLFRRIHHRA